ncbi:hypothetical protein QVD17_37284 [Tagetes erecta]|uniref:Uncharacterized protein n=1 Tax=Tagetes erecta TaxID=13708 RepID=A0AAD8NCL3_TARER|nr:hypothetical protein QVD17_37284 [Tagetes erecta]
MKNGMIITLVVSLITLLSVSDHHHGHLAVAAASGGRMGGTSFRSSSMRRSRTSISSSYSRVHTIPRSSYSRSYSIPRSSCSTTSPVRDVSLFQFGILHCCIFMSAIFSIYYLLRRYADKDRVETSVLKLQVGLSGTARSLQKDLNHIAETADTSSPNGFKYILQETTLSVLQHPDFCISGSSSVEVKKGEDECEKLFKQISVEERNKFDEETLVNFNNIKKQSHDEVSDGVCSQYIVVTIIVAASGVHELPPIKSSELLKCALQKLASIPSNNILAAEVLWTPQKENDCLTEQEMLENFPLLRRL